MDNKVLVGMLVVLKLLEAVATTILDPFFPSEGRRKDITLTQVGIIIGVFPIMKAISTAIVGKGIPVVGSKFTLILGCSLRGLFSILFGTLVSLPDGSRFFAMCIIVATISGIASAMILNAINTTTALFFPGRIAAIQGLTETAYFMGLTIGPPVGGYLFSKWGFKAPFYINGIAIIISSVIACVLVPPDDDDQEQPPTKSYLVLVKSPKMWLLSFTLFIPSMIKIALNVLLPWHLQNTLKATVFQTGLILVVRSGFTFLGSLFVGYYYTRRWLKPLYITALFFISISCLLLGPSPMLPWLPVTLMLTVISLACIGLGNSCITTPMFENMINVAINECGFTNNIDTYAKLSILFETFIAIGEFIGPVLGGFLFDIIGYEWSLTTFAFPIALISSLWFCVKIS